MSRLKLLYYILRTSGMTKVLYSFLIFFLFSAIIIWLVDPNVENLFDAIWFCVAVVATIGFVARERVPIFGNVCMYKRAKTGPGQRAQVRKIGWRVGGLEPEHADRYALIVIDNAFLAATEKSYQEGCRYAIIRDRPHLY